MTPCAPASTSASTPRRRWPTCTTITAASYDALFAAEHPPPATAATGDTFTVNGTGFAPAEQVTVELHSTPIRLGTFTANSTGSISATVTIPGTAPAGSHTIVLTGTTSHATVTYAIAIRVHASAGNWWTTAVVVIAAVIPGLLVWYRVRRRRGRSTAGT